MIVVLSGTNRPGANTRLVAHTVDAILRDAGVESRVVDLADLPLVIYSPEAYATKPAELTPFVEPILRADGILTVVPEYNGSFPGVLKYFIDMLPFPESLVDRPAAFVGLSAGRWGGLRAVEQLKMVFQYRHAHLYGRTCLLPSIGSLVNAGEGISDQAVLARLRDTALGFAEFCRRLSADD